jgi:hypothetical protein
MMRDNMELKIEEIKEAMNIVSQQITNRLLSEPILEIKLGLDVIDDLWLLHDNGKITIRGPLSSDISPKSPDWITFEKDTDQFRIIASANPYAPEMAFFLLEVWKGKKLDSSKLIEHHVEDALTLLENRWKLSGEPIDNKNQRGLIGEIEAVMHIFDVKGMDAVTKWDHTSHDTQDITGDGWAVEAKSIGASSDSVLISSLKQLKWNKGQTLILSVTTVKSKATGKLFPEYVDNRIEILQKKSADAAAKLLLKLQTIGYNDALRSRFKSKWQLPEEEDTFFYLIDENSPTNWWSNPINPPMPKEITPKKYPLDMSTGIFVSRPLKEILL